MNAIIYTELAGAADAPGRTAAGTDPLAVHCDTPGHGEVTADPSLAAEDGWDLGSIDPAGLRRCPQCVKAVQDATADAKARAEADEAEKCPQPRDWAADGQEITFPGPRWMAAAPAVTARSRKGGSVAVSLYGTYGDSAALSKLFDACDRKFGPLDWAAAATSTNLTEPEAEPAPQIVHEEKPAGDEQPLGELSPAAEEHMTAFLGAHNARDGDTTVFEAVADAEQEQPA